MDRRTALAAAGAVVLTVAAGAVAVAANLGLMAPSDGDVGQLQPVLSAAASGEVTPDALSGDGAPTEVETVYVDEYVAPPARSGDDEDDRREGDDRGDEDDDSHDEDEHEEHEYEGGEDDD